MRPLEALIDPADFAPVSRLTPLTGREFDVLMRRLGPFEPRPEIAVACSGGADSMALTILAAGWARQRGGRAIALIVDHGLRAEAAAEALLVRRRLDGLGIAAHILRWTGAKPVTGVQQAARTARYELMERWCRHHAILHLAVGHHLEDQAETVLHRTERSSGADGLAGMAPIRETASVRLLRPLLDTPRERLREMLRSRRIDWVEDPSNLNPAYARARLRARATELAAAGRGPLAVAGEARISAEARQQRDVKVADALARFATLYPQGYATLDRQFFADNGLDIAHRGLNALLCTIGGRIYPVRGDPLDRLYKTVLEQSFTGKRTLSGCLVRVANDHVMIAREAGRISAVAIGDGEEILWDRRFRVRLRSSGTEAPVRRYRLASLDPRLLAKIDCEAAQARARALPQAVRPSLPALYDRRGLVSVPHLGYGRAARNAASVRADIIFLPVRPASFAVFPVV